MQREGGVVGEEPALIQAVEAGDIATVQRLLAASPGLAAARNAGGVSAIMLARYHGREDVLATLLAAGTDLDLFEAAASGGTARVRELLAAAPGSVTAMSADGFTALHFASFFGHAEAARVLLDAGAPVNAVAQNAMRVQPLHSAAAARHFAICALLVERGADVNAAQQGGYTPLHEAAQNGDRPLVELLLAHGADAGRVKDDGQTAAAIAAAFGRGEIAALLDGRS
jgi:ankyrin repeat protein